MELARVGREIYFRVDKAYGEGMLDKGDKG